jgi:flavin reductase (DIM6/NTAB) family NADH-FMN oxidoreductase RutF
MFAMSAPETTLSTQFDNTEFRKAMGTFATGVTVVTTTKENDVVGMTANSFTSISLNPPLVLVSVGKNLSMHGNIHEAGFFGVTVLSGDQIDASNYFAGKRTPEVEATLTYDWHESIPMLSGGLANVACRLWAEYDGGDHTLFLGEVVGLKVHSTANPLLYHGGYRTFE